MGYVINGITGKFDKVGGKADAYFVENGNVLELHWNGSLVHSWTVVPVAPDLSGTPMPFGGMLHLTYPS
jgi:hypothetical protein